MNQNLKNLISKFEAIVKELNTNRTFESYGKLHVRILGQQGLLIRSASLKNFHLLATNDFDALLTGEVPLEDIFKKLLTEIGLKYDENSQYIWLPEETEYEIIYESSYLKIDSPQAIYLIVSKAIKAPEKNKILVNQAIIEFGDSLISLLEKYNADFNYLLEK